MLVRRRIPLTLILRVEGRAILLLTALTSAVVLIHDVTDFDLSLPFVIVGTIGTAVAVLLGFKNSAAYDRWWEGRKIWGDLEQQSRTLGAQFQTFLSPGDPAARRAPLADLVRRHLAFVQALRHQLRGEPLGDDVSRWLSAEEDAAIREATNPAVQVLTNQARQLRARRDEGLIAEWELFPILGTLNALFDSQARAERLASTPLMRHYAYFTTAFVWVFVVLLPFGFASTIGWSTVPLVVVISTVFIMLDRAGTFTEDPFAGGFNDVPITAIARQIEIDMLEQAGLEPVPARLEAVDGVLM